MSARFGRNKRRRAREEVARWQDAHAKAVASAITIASHKREVEMSLAKAVDELNRAKEIAGHLSILFPATVAQVRMAMPRYGEIIQLAPDERMPAVVKEGDDFLKVRMFPIDLLIARIDADAYSEMFHARIEFNSGAEGSSWAYGITHEAWNGLRHDQRKAFLLREIPSLLAKAASTYNFEG